MLFNWFKTKKVKKSTYSKILDGIANIKNNTNDYNVYYSSDYQIISLSVMHKNILRYNRVLEECIICLKTDQVLNKSFLSPEKYNITVRKFLLDDKDSYLNLDTELSKFLTLTSEFIQLYEEKQFLDTDSGVLVYNLYIMKFIVSNLIEVIERLNHRER